MSNLLVHGGQHSVHGLQHGDLGSQSTVEGGKLHADHSAADDGQTVQGTQIGQQAVAGDHPGQVQARNGRQGRASPNRHQDVFRLVNRLAHTDPAGPLDNGAAMDHFHPIAFQQPLHPSAELLHHLTPALIHDGVVETGVACRHAKGGAVQQSLGRDTPPIETGAAQGGPLHQHGAQSELGGPDGGHVAAGAPSDHNQDAFHVRSSG